MHELIAKYLSDNASEDERKMVEKWRGESADNALEFLEFKETWNLVKPIEGSVELPESAAQETKVIGWSPLLKYAAAVILLAMIGSLWYFGRSNDPTTVTEVFAGQSETLEDGTVVSLKDGASIKTVQMTDAERVVSVQGKAFFEVSHDENRPFYVITDNARVKVLGTSFLVNSTEDFTEVCVASGLVNFAFNSETNNMSLNIQKGEMGVIGKDIRGIIKRKNDNRNFLSWKDGILSFERSKMSDVIATLQDTYGTEVDLPKNLMDCQLTAKFNKKSLEEVIQILSATFNWRHDISKSKVVLSGEGC